MEENTSTLAENVKEALDSTNQSTVTDSEARVSTENVIKQGGNNMSKWEAFWEHLNIRKCVVLILLLTFCSLSCMVCYKGVMEDNTELILAGLNGVLGELGIGIGYYFGYNNATNTNNKNTPSVEIKNK
jgi:hypothetical protein